MAVLIRKELTKNSLLSVILFLIVFYVLWGFIYRTTIFGSKSMQYIHLVVIFVLSLYYINRHNKSIITNTCVAWIPYFFYTLGYLTFTLLFQASNFILSVEWYICLFMMLIAVRIPLQNYIPTKFIFWSGVVAIIGIAIQAFLPGFYNSRIAGLFINEKTILGWVYHDYGFSGFTSQVAITARILIYGEIVLLFMKNILLPKRLINKKAFYTLVFIFVFCVLLTGKRLHFLIAASLPIIVPLLTEKNFGRKNFRFLVIILLIIFAGEIFISNLDFFMQTSLFRRFAISYSMAQQGEDITSGRTEFYREAWKAFYDYPIFGIGLGQFSSYTGVNHYVHNTYLQVLCEQGLVGIILFVCALFLSLRNTVMLLKKENNNLNFLKVSLGIQIFYAVYCFTGNELSGAGLVMYFLAIAILVSIEKIIVRNKHKLL